MPSEKQRVVVLGASNKPERYSNKALRALVAAGHEVIPVHPVIKEISGIKVLPGLADVTGSVDTVTLYIGSERVGAMAGQIAELKPNRIIANPGTECDEIRQMAKKNRIEYVEACTLVMLSTGQF